jgi:hypothetical protein
LDSNQQPSDCQSDSPDVSTDTTARVSTPLVAITLEPSRLAAANVVDRLVHCEWNNHGKGAPAIQLDAGKAIVEACTFAKKGTHVHVGKDAASCLAIGNQSQGGFHVENLSSERLQAVANEK